MNTKKTITRSEFVKLSGLGIASLPLLSFSPLNKPYKFVTKAPLNVHLFSKHLQFLDYSEMCKMAAEMGFNGLDVTVRDKGHVLPENVARDLPKVVAEMKKHGLSTEMITTNVLDSKDPNSLEIIKTASNLGFKYYRMGWLDYPENASIPESITTFKKLFSNLEELNKLYGITGVYQNHAGLHVGAPIWDLEPLVANLDPNFMGLQYDIRHAVVEGGTSWELGLQLIHEHIQTIVIKDFKWGIEDGKWVPINVPLGEGMVDFKKYFMLLKKLGIQNPPISLHCEHDLGGAEKGNTTITISKEEVFKRIKKDLEFLQNIWSQID